MKSVGTLNRVTEKHFIQHRDGLLPVSIILDGGGSRSEDEVLSAMQGIPWPPIPRFSIRVKVVDEID